jgi:hypothetical protein
MSRYRNQLTHAAASRASYGAPATVGPPVTAQASAQVMPGRYGFAHGDAPGPPTWTHDGSARSASWSRPLASVTVVLPVPPIRFRSAPFYG